MDNHNELIITALCSLKGIILCNINDTRTHDLLAGASPVDILRVVKVGASTVDSWRVVNVGASPMNCWRVVNDARLSVPCRTKKVIWLKPVSSR